MTDVTITFGASIEGVKSKMAEMASAIGTQFKTINSSVGLVQSTLAGFAGGIGAGIAMKFAEAFNPMALVDFVKHEIDAADHLNDLAQKTGIAAATLGGIGFAASQAGSGLDAAAAAAGKLNKNIAEAAAGNKNALEPFKALGISIKDTTGATKSADVVMAEVANRFATFKDGPEKTALAMRLFGKSGADLIPMLNEGGAALLENIAYYERYGGVTDETAKAADAFNDSVGKLHLINGAFSRTLAAELLPTMQAVADAFLQVRENSDLFKTAASAVRTVIETLVVVGANVAFVFAGVARTVSNVTAILNALVHGEFEKAHEIRVQMTIDDQKAREQLDAFEQRVMHGGEKTGKQALHAGEDGPLEKPKPKPSAPGISDSGAADKAAAMAGKEAAARVALQKAENEAELALQQQHLKEASAIYDDAYKNNLLSIREYYDAKLAIEQRGIASSLEAKRAELAEAQKGASDLNLKEADRLKLQAQAAKLQGEINVLVAREGDAVRANNVAREAAQQKLEAELSAIQAKRDLGGAENQIGEKRAEMEQLKALRRLDADDAFAMERDLEQRNYAATQAFLASKRAQIHGDDKKALAQADADEEAAELQHQSRITSIDRAAEMARRRAGIETAQSVQNSFASMVSGLLNGTTRISDAFKNFAKATIQTFTNLVSQKFTEKLFDVTGLNKSIETMTTAIVNFISKTISKWILGETTKTAATAAQSATRKGVMATETATATTLTGTEVATTVAAEGAKSSAAVAGAAVRSTADVGASATSVSSTATSAIANIGAKAWEAAASVYASIAQIPYVGPFLAPAMAIAAGAVVLGFIGNIASSAGGEAQVDQDRLNFVHRDETILPAPFASSLRSLTGEGGQSPLSASVNEILSIVGGPEWPGQRGDKRVGGMDLSVNEQREGAAGAGKWAMSSAALAKWQSLAAGQPTGERAWWQLPGDSLSRASRAGTGASVAPGSLAAAVAAQQGGGQGTAAGSMGRRGGDTFKVDIRALDGASVRRVLADNKAPLVAALRAAKRDFTGS